MFLFYSSEITFKNFDEVIIEVHYFRISIIFRIYFVKKFNNKLSRSKKLLRNLVVKIELNIIGKSNNR